MTDESNFHDGGRLLSVIPASRPRAITRGLLWLAPALLMGLVTYVAADRLWFGAAGLRNRFVEWSLYVAFIPLFVTTLILMWISIRWLALGLWPDSIGFFAYTDRLDVRLGPLGSYSYAVDRLRVRYFFELDDDEEDGGFEAYLPEEEQIEKYLPRMTHSAAALPIHETILRFAAGAEPDLARQWARASEYWRGKANSLVR